MCIINNNRALAVTSNVVLVQNGRSRFTDLNIAPFSISPPPSLAEREGSEDGMKGGSPIIFLLVLVFGLGSSYLLLGQRIELPEQLRARPGL